MSLPRRIAGNIALDLANTVSWRATDREIDHLTSAENIVVWATDAGLVAHSYDAAASERGVLVHRTHALRLAIGEVGAAIAQGREPPVSGLQVIRDFAANALRSAAISGAPAIFDFEGIDQIVGAIAWAAVDLFRGDELSRLKQCPPDDCQWLFIDRTKNLSRRWCDMATCGNRAKKHAHRHGA